MTFPVLKGLLKVLSEIPNEKFQCSQFEKSYTNDYTYMNNQAMLIETKLILNKLVLIQLDLVEMKVI